MLQRYVVVEATLDEHGHPYLCSDPVDTARYVGVKVRHDPSPDPIGLAALYRSSPQVRPDHPHLRAEIRVGALKCVGECMANGQDEAERNLADVIKKLTMAKE